MSSKSSTKSQAYTVEQAMVGEGQNPGKAEVVRQVGVIGGYGKPRTSVTLDTNFGGGVTHMWVRFSATTPALDTHMKAHGWHYSAKNRLGYHRPADPQAEKFVSELKLVPEAVVTQVQAPKAETKKAVVIQASDGSASNAPKTKPGSSKVAGKVAGVQEVAGKGKTATHTKASELETTAVIAKLEAELQALGLRATACQNLLDELKSRM